MPKNSRSDEGAATSRWSHCADEQAFLDYLEILILVFEVVKSALIEHLSQDLYWRLSPPLFFVWHVEVINKNDVPAEPWAENTFPDTVQLLIYDILSLSAGSLGGEADLDG
jgi:hypothetical protein